MIIDTLCLGSYQTNCYIVRAEDSCRCAIIDPGDEPERVLAFLQKRGLSPDAILLTHGHFDHVGAVKTLVEKTGCTLWMHERDYSQKPTPMNLYLYPLANCEDFDIHLCEEGEEISAGGLTFSVMETAGHTWGSVCYLCEDAMFSGDTLFAGACGRIDLPGGDRGSMLLSLERLQELEEEWRVFPGHGETTILSREKRTNPYLKGLL